MESHTLTDHIVIVIAVPAVGAMTLQRILYFLPSNPRVFVSAMMAALAAQYYPDPCEIAVGSTTIRTHVGLPKVSV